MVFQDPPNISRRAIDRAGDILIDDSSDSESLDKARDILNQWRACHAHPINTFQATLRTYLKKKYENVPESNPIVAQRLKRAPTILNKLREGKNFDIKLLNMQDIAGVRAILDSMDDVRDLALEYRDRKRLQHILHRTRDYLSEPKEKDGYRSIHLIYKYKNKRDDRWDGLWIEVQIRTKLQHSWATAVEAIHTFLGTAIKTRQGQLSDDKWTEFFRLVSSAFAHIEGTPTVRAHSRLTPTEIWKKVIKFEKELRVIDKLEAFRVAETMIKRGHFHLIILNTKEKTVGVASFGKDEFDSANEQYTLVEKKNENTPEIEAVLVSSNEVEKAYPSFFADTKDFVKNLRYVLSGVWIPES